ncbi:Tripartite tricarboxylate transporter TctB family protein [Lentibacillus persicus]|uniref:Tripartite tricarboxylate transporter TctB family protein n=1 Tax=Lentibacillus persicus TaxID=640948 RepID=A0A1I1VWG1_9BACI|nr:tripartite tricarboxylate transporter TctB family protein [Lentibacillus persicus]SFD87307.1 Tripartite tricarboxylate transporter TctB family protein [Lentibacillus persicus]
MTIKSQTNLLVSAIVLIISIFVFISTFNINGGAAYFPFGLSILLGLLSIILMVNSLEFVKINKHYLKDNVTKRDNPFYGPSFKRALVAGLMSTVYVVLFNYVGFIISTLLFIPSFFLFMQIKGYLKYIFITLGFIIFIYIIFVTILRVFLPAGIIFD